MKKGEARRVCEHTLLASPFYPQTIKKQLDLSIVLLYVPHPCLWKSVQKVREIAQMPEKKQYTCSR